MECACNLVYSYTCFTATDLNTWIRGGGCRRGTGTEREREREREIRSFWRGRFYSVYACFCGKSAKLSPNHPQIPPFNKSSGSVGIRTITSVYFSAWGDLVCLQHSRRWAHMPQSTCCDVATRIQRLYSKYSDNSTPYHICSKYLTSHLNTYRYV